MIKIVIFFGGKRKSIMSNTYRWKRSPWQQHSAGSVGVQVTPRQWCPIPGPLLQCGNSDRTTVCTGFCSECGQACDSCFFGASLGSRRQLLSEQALWGPVSRQCPRLHSFSARRFDRAGLLAGAGLPYRQAVLLKSLLILLLCSTHIKADFLTFSQPSYSCM